MEKEEKKVILSFVLIISIGIGVLFVSFSNLSTGVTMHEGNSDSTVVDTTVSIPAVDSSFVIKFDYEKGKEKALKILKKKNLVYVSEMDVQRNNSNPWSIQREYYFYVKQKNPWNNCTEDDQVFTFQVTIRKIGENYELIQSKLYECDLF